MSKRELIKSFDDISKKVVTIPVWEDMQIEMRSMRGTDRISIFSKAEKKNTKGKTPTGDPWTEKEAENLSNEVVLPLIVVKTAFDPETGERVFEDNAVDWLVTKNANAFEILVAAAMEVNGLNKDAVKDAEGNS